MSCGERATGGSCRERAGQGPRGERPGREPCGGGPGGGPRGERPDAGTTLVELLVVLVIVSILAVVAIPMAETAVQRRQELELRETLRTTRRAIDAFHDDWTAERIDPEGEAASDAGYPVSLDVLVEGVDLATDPPERRRYLRRPPENPFGDGWRLRGHAQDPGGAWDGEDVYDLAADTDRLALDGTRLADW